MLGGNVHVELISARLERDPLSARFGRRRQLAREVVRQAVPVVGRIVREAIEHPRYLVVAVTVHLSTDTFGGDGQAGGKGVL